MTRNSQADNLTGASTTGGRAYWADSLRGLAVTLVVLQHASGVPDVILGAIDTPVLQQAMRASLAPFRIPVLLVLSGLMLERSLRKPLPVYGFGKICKVVWPFVLWSVITVVAAGERSHLASFWYWIGGPFHMWYLSVLIVAYMVGVLTRWVPSWAITIAFIAMLVIVDPQVGSVRRALFYGAIFFFGASLRPVLSRWMSLRPVLPALLGVVAIGIAGGGLMGAVSVDPKVPWTLAYVAPGVLAILWAWPRLPRIPALEFLGRRSMVLYCVHFPVQVLISRWFGFLALDHSLLLILACGLGGLVIPILMIYGYDRVRLLFELPMPSFLKRSR
ncbi:acyltransferase family protein [Actinomyces faecalis]|uniref:acyltransferase family protein n=1 Tax=Actinomyces faecalis TaxID=2722820 RepID=UPI0018853A8B|nr:acyltransferase [Actinomyces faecalis]